MSRLAEAIGRIRELDVPLAEVLGCWLDRFQIEKIVQFAEKQGR